MNKETLLTVTALNEEVTVEMAVITPIGAIVAYSQNVPLRGDKLDLFVQRLVDDFGGAEVFRYDLEGGNGN